MHFDPQCMAAPQEVEEDPFEALLFTEDKLQRQGYEEGYQHGMTEGLREAVEAGWNNGWDVGSEIGYYLGFTETWLRLLKKEATQERTIRALTGLGDKISDFQVLNVKSGNYANEFAQIQAKFKQVLSLLKIPVEFNQKTKLSF